ncbi:MAG: substrate-binding domain-containing protein [Bacteroidales bacterium]|nr:substrate-binding domain-containing protein [Bacteroidales bacterium]
MIKILVLIDYSTEFSRLLINGLIRYAQESRQWTFYRLPLYYRNLYGEEGIIERAKEWNVDFVIVQWDFISLSSLERLQVPVFLEDYKEEGKSYSNITGDYLSMGGMAAKFFIQRRYKNYAFYGKKGFIWSNERAEGFRREIEKTKGNYYFFESEALHEVEWRSNHVQLEDWLLSLPKPVALFACDDSFALQVSELCKINNIKIPDEIALLGVDNDNLICNLSDPQISSIVLDAEKGGYELGRKIEMVVKRKDYTPFNITINPLRIELRGSTDKYNVDDIYIGKIIKYIESNFHLNISINQLTDLVPLSRRSLEIRFKKAMGTSLYQFIINVRMNHFINLLTTTKIPMSDLSIQSGFNDYSNAFRIFKRMKGCSPVEYREKLEENKNSENQQTAADQ